MTIEQPPPQLIAFSERLQGIYFDCLINDNPDYNISAAIRSHRLDRSKMQHALDILIQCQSALRMKVVTQNDEVFFHLSDRLEYPIEEYFVAEPDYLLQDWSLAAYDLHNGPLFRVKLLHSNTDETLLFIGLHHLIGDGTSLVIFINQLFQIYENLQSSDPISLESDQGFISFLQDDRELLEQGKLSREASYWTNYLAGANIPRLHPDLASNKVTDAVAQNCRHRIDDSLYQQLSRIAKDLEITPFMLTLGVFAIFLGKQTGTHDITFSTAFNHRPGFDQDDSIGFFIANLPLRFDVSPEVVVKDVLDSAKQSLYQAYANIDYPIHQVIRQTGLVDETGQSVLDISFISDAYDLTSELALGFYPLPVTTFPGQLMVLLEDMGDGVYLNFQSKVDQFFPETIDLFAQRYLYLLEQIVADPKQSLASLELISPQEQAKICQWHDTDAFSYQPQTMLEYFNRRLERSPQEPALVWEGGSLSLQQIDERSNQLAQTILAMGVASEARIGVALERSPELIISLIAIMKAGGVYIPIDPTYPADRKAFILQDAAIELVITDQPADWSVKVLDPTDPEALVADVTAPKIHLAPEQLAYIEYTSGTTGRPKGVMIEHHSITHVIRDLERRFPLESSDAYLLKTTFTFDIFGTEFYGWLIGQGKLVILPPEAEKNSQLIAQAIADFSITHINFVPSMFHLFLDYVLVNQLSLESLKWIFVGGEAISPLLVEKYLLSGISAKLENVYGPTEETMWATHYPIRQLIRTENTPIGQPLSGYRAYILDEAMKICPIGVMGQLYLAGPGTARGYLNLPEKTAEVFLDNPFYQAEVDPPYYQRLYATGDLARWLSDGNLEFFGRSDSQVKVNGVRMELGEIEACLQAIPGIINAAVVVKQADDLAHLIAVYESDTELQPTLIEAELARSLPPAMIPHRIERMERLVYLSNGKVDRKTILSRFDQVLEPKNNQSKDHPTTQRLKQIWQDLLLVSSIDEDKSFFEHGGSSLKLLALQTRIQQAFGAKLSLTQLLSAPRIDQQARLIGHTDETLSSQPVTTPQRSSSKAVAIIGMGIDLPGASELGDFWTNLIEQRETIRHYEPEELIAYGIAPSEVAQPNYIRSRGSLDHLDQFDPEFFGLTPGEVRLASPQLRVLYQTAWRAIEDAGLSIPHDNQIGVYIGGSDDFDWYRSGMLARSSFSDVYQSYTMSTNHFLATRLSFQFNLRGPSVSSLSGCSTSLLTVHQAYQAILAGECDVALAGGITVELPNHGGYEYIPGMMFSPDGHVRPFDANAAGTVFSNGCGIVVLKDYEQAIKDGDQIYARILGSAINNDGHDKQSFTAPSVTGQAEVMQRAHHNAGITADTIQYVEAHGTGTFLGDPIEVESLSRAFAPAAKQSCVLGSVKGNIGHTDTAAGVIGLIKSALALKHRYFPGTLNYHTPNPNIDFVNTPFVVHGEGAVWPRRQHPRRAAINSFGVGGTNVHMVLEEAELTDEPTRDDSPVLLSFSAKSEESVKATASKILDYLYHQPVSLKDAALTLNQRSSFNYRSSLCLPADFRDQPLSDWLEKLSDQRVYATHQASQVVFMFSGQGTQYQSMAQGLYENQTLELCQIFRREVDRVLACLEPADETRYRDILFGTADPQLINQTKYAQLSIFTIEYALAQALIGIGIRPDRLIGHSIGELSAAAVASVWSLSDAVDIILRRSELMQAQPAGEMIAISASRELVRDYLSDETWISLENTTDRVVIGGTFEAIGSVKQALEQAGIHYSPLVTSHAFHTPLMEPARDEFLSYLQTKTFQLPATEILSNVHGGRVPQDMFCQPDYWADQIVSTVRFEEELTELLATPLVGIEIGPGRTLCSFAGQHQTRSRTEHHFIHTIRRPKDVADDVVYLLTQLGQLWSQSGLLDRNQLLSKAARRIHLPSYVFDLKSYPIQLSAPEALAPIEVSDTFIPQVFSEDQFLSELIACYQEVFGYEEISPQDDFFEMGGDSLKAASLSGLIMARTGASVSVQEIFQSPTPQRLLQTVDHTSVSQVSKITAAPVAEDYPLSSAQARMYTFWQMDRDGLAYNLPSASLIEGQLDEARVIQAFKKLVQLHDSLRTRFILKDGDLRQVIEPEINLPIRFSRLAEDDTFDYDAVFEEFVRPFDLNQAPMFRAHVIEVSPRETILLFDMHHIIADATAAEIISGDFSALYAGEQVERGRQFVDYAVWERQFHATPEYDAQRNYWLNQLMGELPRLNLPTDGERPKYLSFEGGRYHFTIPKQLSSQVAAYSKAHNSSNFMTLLAMWGALLSRLSGDEDIIIGTPVAGRNREEVGRMVGMFVNMLPIRSFPEQSRPASDYLSEVRQTVLDALSNQDYQFDQLVEDLAIERNLSRNAVFDVSFDYHNIALENLLIDGLVARELTTPIQASSIDLLLTLSEHEGELSGFIDYSSRLFQSETIANLAEMFLNLSASILKQPELAIAEHALLSEKDRAFYLEQPDRHHLSWSEDLTLCDLIAQQAKLQPDTPAVLLSQSHLSYRELDTKANGIAHALIEGGLNRGDAVGIYARRRQDLIPAMLGVLKSGGCYVMLDPAYPSERLQYMIDQSGLKQLIVLADETLEIDCPPKIWDSRSITPMEQAPEVRLSGDDVCYISYTSGTTGQPKGIEVLHRGLSNLLADHLHQAVFLPQTDRLLSLASPSFDIFGMESVLPLAAGCAVYLADESECLDAALLADVIASHKVSMLQATVSRLQAMVGHPAFAKILPKLRVIISGGEHCPISLIEYLQQATKARLLNMYGPTETTITATMADLTHATKVDIGSPLANVSAYILSPAGKLQPIGVYGELCIGGAGLSRGYHDQPELTAAAFIPLAELPERMVYRTGDLARWNNAGTIDLIGRVDHQVKHRGYRIELGEIEKTVLEIPTIENAIVKQLQTADQSQLVLFYIATGQDEAIEETIKQHLRSRLPEYMLPDVYQQRDEFPLLPSKKIDRTKLVLEHASLVTPTDSKPVNGLESTILAIWQDVLHQPDIGPEDNFFDIGGNSFNLMLVNNRLNERLDQPISLMSLFEFPTIRSLAHHLSGAKTELIESPEVLVEDNQPIAVIGLAGRFPGASNIRQLWHNLLRGEESITRFTPDELAESGIDPAVYQAPNYVNAKGYLADTEFFDYEFFQYTKKEAEKMDPQIRLFHQCVYHALEDAGYDSQRYDGKIALFGGSSSNLPWMMHQMSQAGNEIEQYELMTLNDKDFLTTKVSYKLNLKGMSANVQTACSTSLVAVHQAVKHLQSGESDLALAGGVSITYPQKEGYPWYEGMIFSRDGHCRPFDKDASGTLSGNGCGVVVLKRLTEALRDKDQIYAVIKGSAVNNDGAQKIGYTAPSVSGQRTVIETALKRSGVAPEAIRYVEAHGTGTSLGDPIEIEGLKQAWRTERKNYCAIGSIKSNIGHLDAAAGIAGFIKSVLIVNQRQIPGLINFSQINPKIDLANSPFYINTEPVACNGEPLHVAVSAFGMGGTNAHVILGEAPSTDKTPMGGQS